MRRANAAAAVVAQQRRAACSAAIAGANPRVGNECANIPGPASIFTWQ